MQPADRVQHRHTGPRTQREDGQPDPEPARRRRTARGCWRRRGRGRSDDRVQAVRASDSTTRGPADDAASRAPPRPGAGSGMPLVAAQPRLAPQRAERDEGDDQGRGGPDDDRGERQRQVLRASRRRGRAGGAWARRWRERASARRRALRPPVSARRRTAASAAGGASRPRRRPGLAPVSTIATGVPALTSFSTSKPCACSWSSWSLVTVRVRVCPTGRSTWSGRASPACR